MTIGLHVCSYECKDLLSKFLEPWIQFRSLGYKLKISFGHCCFRENYDMGYPILSSDGSHEALQQLVNDNVIDNYTFINFPATEVEARQMIFNPIKDVDYLWLAAPDEIYTLDEILKTVNLINQFPFIYTFRIEFKNLTFNEKTYTKGFSPTRIFKQDRFKIHSFIGDDEVCFVIDKDMIVPYHNLAQKKIPVAICNPLHYTWLSNEMSRKKVLYQEKRWSPPNGFGCSFKWNSEKKCLEWNEEYFKASQQSIPELYTI